MTIGNSVTSIGFEAFEYCSGLTSVHITDLDAWCNIRFWPISPDKSNPLSYAHHLYLNGEEIKNLVIPNSVTTIEDYLFSGCTGLTSVTIPNSVTSIESSAFSSCTGLNSVTIGNSVTAIRSSAFLGCTNLTTLTIPNSVEYIAESAFYGCTGLTSVIIGNSVTKIDNRVFYNCSKLEEVYCFAEKVPSTWADAFEKSYPEYATLYVPAASLNDYKNTVPWSQFGTIKAIGGSGEESQKCATPTISYGGKRLTFSCATDGVEFVSDIKDTDIKRNYGAAVDLTATYEISVYATKSGYENSDVATATLVWTSATFTETTGTHSSAKAVVESIPVLISAQNGTISVNCEQEGQPIAVYTTDGKTLGNASVSGGQATIATPLKKGQVAIVKVGNRSVKIVM